MNRVRNPAKTVADMLPAGTVTTNCARCNRLLVVSDVPGEPWWPEAVAAYVYGKATCWRCLAAARREPKPPANKFGTGGAG